MISKSGRFDSKGRDDFGLIELYDISQCGRCGRTDIHTVRYLGPFAKMALPEYVKQARNLILKQYDKRGEFQRIRLGIECGCYARFHRQVAHINGGKK